VKLPLFIKQNEEKWNRFEKYLDDKSQIDPEVLSNLYLEIFDDLSYAKTFYPNSGVIPYLNGLAVKVHQNIYRNKKESSNRLISFFKRDFPKSFYDYQGYLLISFIVFFIFAIIGWYSMTQDESFVRLILGDNYVNMTLENIKNGDPMAVYKQGNSVDMFLGITINNIRVAMQAFVFGIIFMVGTLYVMMYNGIMLGSFLAFFAKKDLLWEAFRTIWIHGTIEISVIIVAGAAGLVLGSGILFPKTYTRLDSLKIAAKAGLKIMMSTIPFFIIAGFLEGFVTKHTEMPNALAVFIILSSLLLILFYYVFYPIVLNNKSVKNGK